MIGQWREKGGTGGSNEGAAGREMGRGEEERGRSHHGPEPHGQEKQQLTRDL